MQSPDQNQKLKSIKAGLLWALAAFAALAVLSSINLSATKPQKVDMATFISAVEQNQIQEIKVDGEKILFALQDGSQAETIKEPGQALSEIFADYQVNPEKTKNLKTEIVSQGGAYWASILIPSLGSLILMGVLLFFLFRQVSGANNKAISFGQANARETQKNDKNRITFANVAGAKEAKEELHEIVEFLKNPKKFTAVGAKIPKGVLLMGSPGTGKTLLARAVAGEADVPFLHISGSEFVEMFVGVGAARVRDLFTRAKKQAPCIIFIDEIDAVGRQRGTGMGGNHDEREQTLNQILVEMDGFEPNNGVIVLAATNRPDVLDKALLRPGRFDRRVMLDPPDINEREAILKIHAEGKPLAKDVNLRRLAERTAGFSGADLANLINEAAIFTARKNKGEISQEYLLSSIEKVLLGPERKSHLMNDQERKITAYHEAGHAIVAHLLPSADEVHKVSIISRGRAAGYTLKLPAEDTNLQSKASFKDDLAAMLGGFVAENMFFKDVTTGPCNDLSEATKIARRMVTEFGMSEKLGPRVFIWRNEEMGPMSDKIGEEIERETTAFIQEAQAKAQELLTQHKAEVEKLVQVLLEKEVIEKEEFAALFPNAPQKTRPQKASRAK